MPRALLLIVASLCGLAAPMQLLAQEALAAKTVQVELERRRIGAERLQQELLYIESEKACFQRFAVTDCLRQASATRRLVLNELRRQELVLNDLERQAKASEATNRTQKKRADQQAKEPESLPGTTSRPD